MAGRPSLSSAGLVGISLSSAWGEPVDFSNKKDVDAAERYLQFSLGWFANPIYHGDYPEVMKDYVGESIWLNREKRLSQIGEKGCPWDFHPLFALTSQWETPPEAKHKI